MSLLIHIALFFCIALTIVAISVFYSEAEDARAFRSLPRRLLTFAFGCTVLALIVLVCELVFGSVR